MTTKIIAGQPKIDGWLSCGLPGLPLATANKTWLWLEKRHLWLIKISTFLSSFLIEIPNLRKCGEQKFWPINSPGLPMQNPYFLSMTTFTELLV
jgi:hypothetical protein